jgi:hypothetical protein
MNKRRRYKAKARRAEAAFWRRAARPAMFKWWRSRVERGLPVLTDAERAQATAALNAAIRAVYDRCERPPMPEVDPS